MSDSTQADKILLILSDIQCYTPIAHALLPLLAGLAVPLGLPYIPRVPLSEGSLVRSPLKWLWSEEPMVRRAFIPKFLYSESCNVPKIPYSERPSTIWILCYEDSLVRSSSNPKGAMFRTSIFRKSPLPHTGSILRRSFSPKFPSSKIAMFRRFYLPNFARSIRILCYEGPS